MTAAANANDLVSPEEAEPAPKKASAQILQHELQEAGDALERGAAQLFFSGMTAGLEIGLGLFLMARMHTITDGQISPAISKLLVANMYAFGYIVVVLGRSELFTEQTSLAILPVLNGTANLTALARVWALVYVGNLVGAAIVAALITWFGTALGEFTRATLAQIAKNVVSYSPGVIVMSGILAGWLMGLLSWLVSAGRDTISQVVIIWMIAAALGLGQLHHAIMGSVEVLAGVFASADLTLADFGHFLLWTTIGNAIGGPVFVALLKYTQVETKRLAG